MTSGPIFSTPALVLTLGNSMLPALAKVKRIHLQSDARRAVVTRFLALCLHPRRGEVEWTSIEDAPGDRVPSGSWKDAFEKAQRLGDTLGIGIRTALHELRAHEKLIEIGLGDRNALPMDVYLIADLTEPDASVLLAVIPVIQSLLKDEPCAVLHLLLNIAVFDESPLSHANVSASLENLHQLVQAQDQGPNPQIYLFDRFKEGVWEAQDMTEVQTILGNVLLALLSGGLAQQIVHQLPQADVEQFQAYFCGASAVAVVLDMEMLQQMCALRLGREIIENEFHSRIDPNPARVDDLAGTFLAEHVNPDLWRQDLCRETLFHASTGDPDLGFHISDLQFEGIPMEDWGDAIRAYDEVFRSARLLTEWAMVKKNSDDLGRKHSDDIAVFAQALPLQTRLYPGGVRAARMVLEKIRSALLGETQESGDEHAIEKIEKEWTSPIQTSLEWLENAIRKLPKPPRWIMRLPAFLRLPAVQLFNLIYLHRDLKTVTDLREASLRLVEKKYVALMNVQITQSLNDLRRAGIVALEKQIRSLKRLQARLDKLPDHLASLEIDMGSGESLFRLSALNEILLAWAYYQGKRPPSGFRQSLLAERDFLGNWQGKDRKTLAGELLQFCREVYGNLSDIDLEEVLAHRNGKEATDLASALAQGAIPLLRPDFDQTGSGPSYQMRFFIGREPHCSSILSLVKNDLQDWQEISSGDPHLILCCRVRVMLPFTSLQYIFERERNFHDALDAGVKDQYVLSEGK